MKNVSITIMIFCIFASSCTKKNIKIKKEENMPSPPIAKKIPQKLELHGDVLVDNYAWMRLSDEQKESEKKDEQTQQVLDYLNAENEYAKKVLKPQEALEKELYQEMIGRIKKDDDSVPYLDNGYWYYTRYEEEKEYGIYCRKKGTLTQEEKIMLDGNVLAKGLEYFALGDFEVSPNGKILAYCTDTISRRIYTYYFKNLETGKLLPNTLKNAQPGVAWAKDSKTVFYTAKNETTLLSEKVYRHDITQSQEKDVLVYHEKDPTYYIGVYATKSEDYIVIYNVSTLTSQYHILNASTPNEKFTPFYKREDKLEYGIEHHNDKWIIRTNYEAKNFRLMETSVQNTSKDNWKELIPHRKDVFLESFEVFEEFLVIDERINGLTHFQVTNWNTKEKFEIPFLEEAYTAGFSVNIQFDTPILRYSYSSMTTPSSIYDYNMKTKRQMLKKRQIVVGGHEPKNYKIERIELTARDGVKVPVSLVYNKRFRKSESEPLNLPLLLYAYGSYGYIVDPSFSNSRRSLLDRGFIFAIAHIRGGQMLGREWYEKGKMHHKLNTFYDFIDCAKGLIEQKYTQKDKLFAMGGSAGGLLMGAVVNMAPELFKGVIADVPFVDVINTMYDETIPLTTNEFSQWGNPKVKEDYEYIKQYSPYENVTNQDYPNMLVLTGFFDSQVQYWEPAKWVANLRAHKTDDNLLLFKTEMDFGHGGASGRFKVYKEIATKYAFILSLLEK